MPIGSIRVYPDVQFIGTDMVNDVSVYHVQLQLQLISQRKIDWDRSKRLLNGSLLVLTPDNFETVYFAVVSVRKCEDLDHGKLGISWEGAYPKWNPDEKFLMIESEVYFEAYRYVFLVFKEICIY